jgi:hypothetical protein
MIARSLAVAALLFVAYELHVRALAVPVGLHEVRFQWQRNLVRVQEFLNAPPPPCVLVGSSMSVRLDAGALGPGARSLALGGIGPLDGLAILERLAGAPPLVLIEVNLLAATTQSAFLDDVFAEPAWRLRAHLPSLLEKHRPSVVLTRRPRRWYYWLRDKIAMHAPRRDAAAALPGDITVDAALQRRLVEEQIARHEAELARPTPAGELDAAAATLAAHVRRLKSAGSRVVLFECPIHPRLRDSAQMRALRGRVAELARELDVAFATPPLTASFETSDALHLAPAGARDFARWLAVTSGCTAPARAAPSAP